MKKKPNYLTGLYLSILKKETQTPIALQNRIGWILQIWYQAEMTPNASTNGTSAISRRLQKPNGKEKKMTNCSGLFLTKVLNNGKKSQMSYNWNLELIEMENNVGRDGTTF